MDRWHHVRLHEDYEVWFEDLYSFVVKDYINIYYHIRAFDKGFIYTRAAQLIAKYSKLQETIIFYDYIIYNKAKCVTKQCFDEIWMSGRD